LTRSIDLSGKFLTINGLSLRYVEYGAGRPLLLLHGLPAHHSADQWRSNFAQLATSGHRVYAIDLPGWGRSDAPSEFSFDGWVDTLRGFVDALQLEVVDLLGQSLGGWIAALFASQNPERVRRFAWLAQAGMNARAPKNAATFRLLTREALLEEYANDPAWPAIYETMMSNPEREAVYRRMLDYINTPDVRERYNIRSRLPHMTMPILFANGDSNRTIPVELTVEGFRLAPLGRLAIAVGGRAAGGGYNSTELVDAALRFFAAEHLTPA
jgi:pimeloyl-ACP methyl ester carboxylesterase